MKSETQAPIPAQTIVRLITNTKPGNKRAIVRCGCGYERPVVIRGDGTPKSARCSKCRNKKHGEGTPGVTVTVEYETWRQLRARCLNPKNERYADYGGRGITVCERWNSYENFLADMGRRPMGMTIDRKDVNGPYAPENCRWATDTQQQNNRRCNHVVTAFGKTQTLMEWSREAGVHYETLRRRLLHGVLPEVALTQPLRRSLPLNVERLAEIRERHAEGATITIIARDLGIAYTTVSAALSSVT